MLSRGSFLLAGFLLGSLLTRDVAGAPHQEEMRLGYAPNITHAQALYARAKGSFESQLGCPIRWTSFLAGPSIVEALFTDAIDVAFLGPGPTINGFIKSRGEKFVVIAGSASGGAGLVVRQDAGIRSATEFGGKTIATPQLGNTQDVAARTWFGQHGYRLKEKGGDLTIIALSNSDMLAMFRQREIDGAWAVEPWLSRLEFEAKGELFLDEKSLWPEGRFVTTHLVVSKAYLGANPKRVRKLLEALVDLTQTINADKEKASIVLNEQIKVETGKPLPPEVMKRAMQRVELTWDPLASSLRRCATSAHEIGFLRAQPDLNGIYALRPLNEILQARGLPSVQDR